MALHSRWSSGDLIFYDGLQDILAIKNASQGLEVGEDSSGVPFKFYGNTASAFMNWDSVNDELVFDLADIAMGDTDYIMFGDDDDITMAWDATQFVILPDSSGSDMHFGSANKPLDVVNYGNVTYRDPDTSASTGDVTLTNTSTRIMFIDPVSTGTTRVKVNLPPATGSAGIEFTIFCASTGSSGGGLTVCSSVGGSEVFDILEMGGGKAQCDGTSWLGFVGSSGI